MNFEWFFKLNPLGLASADPYNCGLNFIDLDCLLDNGIYMARNKTGLFTPYYKDESRIWV